MNRLPLGAIGPFRIHLGLSMGEESYRFVVTSSEEPFVWKFDSYLEAWNWINDEGNSLGLGAVKVQPLPLPVFAGISVICIHEGRALVGRRGVGCGHGRGHLSFPGGKLDQGVDLDLKTAGEREFAEEVGLPCRVLSSYTHQPEVFTTNCFMQSDDVHYITIYLKAEPAWEVVDTTSPLPGKEPEKCDQWQWMSLEEISDEVDIKLRDATAAADDPRIQWMPLPQLLFYFRHLGLVVVASQ